MYNDPEVPGDPEEQNKLETSDQDEPAERGSVFRASIPSLDAFAAIQRNLAFIDFSAVQAAQRSFEHTGVLKKITEAQEAIAKDFARSINFSGIAATHKAIVDAGLAAQAMGSQKQWADSLAKSLDFAALNRAVSSSAALHEWARTSAAFNESLRKQTELFARVAEGITFKLPTIDIPGLRAALNRWLPVNLRDFVALDVVASVALDEGIPLSWVPRAKIVILLIEADGQAARVGILADRRNDILDDCEEALGLIAHEWAVQCRSAIAAMRANLDGPAQSHASNIIDSIVLGLHGKNGREHAKTRAQEEFDELPLQLAAENLSLRPLFRAFTTWFPNTGIDPPDYFARHATSHAVGHPGVFAPVSALVAVMLATSLTVQYAPDEPSIGLDDSDSSP
ncbi:MAG TPA: hypothetical protein VMV96_03015 [Acidimicrobiales bacterium]|nr:hypothetical protein [Acidimicrobiales bacterium]